MKYKKLIEIVASHIKWLNGDIHENRADLRRANLRGADLCQANLRRADLCGADLRQANLYQANLYGADLCQADLRRADLCGADLRQANLNGANLCGADLRRANLRGADLCQAKLNWNSHHLISDILFQKANGIIEREMLAAFIEKKVYWCFYDWEIFQHPEKQWAIETLRPWWINDESAPLFLKMENEI